MAVETLSIFVDIAFGSDCVFTVVTWFDRYQHCNGVWDLSVPGFTLLARKSSSCVGRSSRNQVLGSSLFLTDIT